MTILHYKGFSFCQSHPLLEVSPVYFKNLIASFQARFSSFWIFLYLNLKVKPYLMWPRKDLDLVHLYIDTWTCSGQILFMLDLLDQQIYQIPFHGHPLAQIAITHFYMHGIL